MTDRQRAASLAFMLAIALVFLTACGGSDSAAPDDASAAAQPLGPAEQRLSLAIDAGLTDCFDPLHDSDGSGGFFAFCEQADAAKAAGQIDCLDPSYKPDDPACDQWRLEESAVPFYYFDIDTQPTPESAGPSPTEPPAREQVVGKIAVLEWVHYGGCAMIGDQCGHYTVYLDGTVEAADSNAQVLATATVDLALLDPVLAVEEVPPALVESLPPGPCEAGNDGISEQIRVVLLDLRLDTCEVDISGDTSPFITGIRELGEAAVAAAPIDWDAAG